MKRLTVSTILILTVMVANAQMVKYNWSLGLCSYEGEFDSTKITRTQLNNTLHTFLPFIEPRVLEMEDNMWKPEQMNNSTLRRLKKEYKSTLKKIKNLELIHSDFWEEQRKYKMETLKAHYDFYKLALKAYKNPNVLRRNYRDTCCLEYVNALIAGGDSLLNEWNRLWQQACIYNVDKAQCIEVNYIRKFNSSEKLQWAKFEVLILGWRNHAMGQYIYIHSPKVSVQWQFENIFQNVKHGCEL